MAKDLKFLTVPFEVKVAQEKDGKGIIEGYASTWDLDQGLDIVEPGAFAKSIHEKPKFPILADHRWDAQIGWNIEAKEDDVGLWVRGRLDIENNPKAREKWGLAKMAMDEKAEAGISIGYLTIKSEPDRERPAIRRLKELKLMEWSMVAFPMNTAAMVLAAKSYHREGVERSVGAFVRSLKEAGHDAVQIAEALVRAADEFRNPDPSAADEAKDLELVQLLNSTAERLFRKQ